MQGVRRLASIAVIAVLGATVLAGCRSEPGVAAYLGAAEITEDRVTAIIAELREVGEAPSPTRREVVTMLLLNQVCERLSADRGFPPRQQVTPEQVAQQFGYPAGSDWAREQARSYTCFSGLPVDQQVAPTTEELADLVERGREAGFVPATMSDADAARQLDREQLRSALARRDLFNGALAGYDVTVNPRYRPLEYPLLNFRAGVPAVSVPLGEGDSETVIDADADADADADR
jgi:hypothetical protein